VVLLIVVYYQDADLMMFAIVGSDVLAALTRVSVKDFEFGQEKGTQQEQGTSLIFTGWAKRGKKRGHH